MQIDNKGNILNWNFEELEQDIMTSSADFNLIYDSVRFYLL
jgi:hypothetical protein